MQRAITCAGQTCNSIVVTRNFNINSSFPIHDAYKIMPLLSRTLDPLLGVLTGVLAYYLAEKNPRTAPPPGESLGELVRWKRDKWWRQQSEVVRNPELGKP